MLSQTRDRQGEKEKQKQKTTPNVLPKLKPALSTCGMVVILLFDFNPKTQEPVANKEVAFKNFLTNSQLAGPDFFTRVCTAKFSGYGFLGGT